MGKYEEEIDRQIRYQDELAWLMTAEKSCDHIGCLKHVTHPCEGCGRVAGRREDKCGVA